MGYYVNITDGSVLLKKEDQTQAYKIMCSLNDKDNLKSGGAYGGANDGQKWFSWMDPDYPSKCKNCEEIFEHLGFEFDVSDNGDICIHYYDGKIGDESHFFEAIGHLLTGELHWRGEDGAMWKWEFSEKGMFEKTGRVVYD